MFKRKLALFSFLLLMLLQLKAFSHSPDSIVQVKYYKTIIDDPEIRDSWAIGVATSYFYMSNIKRPIAYTLNGFFHIYDFKIDFQASQSFSNPRAVSPVEIEPIEPILLSKFQLMAHKRIFAKTSPRWKKLNSNRETLNSEIFKREMVFCPIKVQRSLELNFGANYFQLPDFEIVNIGNLPDPDFRVPRLAGNANYTSLSVGISYKENHYLKYKTGDKLGFSAGYRRFYFNYSYCIFNEVELYEEPHDVQIKEEYKQEYLAIYNSGWSLGFESHYHILSSPIVFYYQAEIAWKPHFHDPNTTLDHISNTGLTMIFSTGLRLANLNQ
mgnify:CR=1 FL=1|tara:strand:+ start:1816 stop:2793 length:978 start_codon:yes stop_codon:yes gene_type:complete